MPSLYFNPRGPCGPRPGLCRRGAGESDISILAVLADRDLLSGLLRHSCRRYFNPRGPCGPRRNAPGRPDFNPRGPCGPRLGTRLPPRYSGRYFNPRGPCGPRRHADSCDIHVLIFQSSRSLRTATKQSGERGHRHKYFNPRGPCGPRLCIRTTLELFT